MTEQAHSEVFYRLGAIQLGDRPNKAGGAYLLVGRGGSFGCLRLNCPASLQLGGGGGGGSPGTR